MVNKILTTAFVMGSLLFTTVNAEEVKSKKTEMKKGDKANYVVNGFEAIDINSDGYITIEEFETFSEKNFDKLDTNKDGVITKEEFVKGKEKMKASKSKNMKKGDKKCDGKECPCPVGEIFDKMDRNDDGKLTKKEFMKKQKKEFKKMDKNNDKKVSLEEYSEYKAEKMKKMKEKREEKLKKEMKKDAKKASK